MYQAALNLKDSSTKTPQDTSQVFDKEIKAQGKLIIAAMENKLPHCLIASCGPSLAQANPPFGKSPKLGISLFCLVNQNASHNTIPARMTITKIANVSEGGRSISVI